MPVMIKQVNQVIRMLQANKCDQICEEGSYSFSKFPLLTYNSSWLFAIVVFYPAIEPCSECKVTKFQTGTIQYSQVKLWIAK